ncbi:MAG: SDR family NAD(P)-dependent oxidoreductase [Gammaproteobacteria bacterium]
MNATPRRVWITGASSGLGAALAREYAAGGWQVLLSARPGPRLEAMTAELGASACSYAVDVTDAAAVTATIAAIESDGGLPDLVILNAGTYRPMSLDSFDATAVADLFAVNVFSVTTALAALLPGLRRRGTGHIAITGSVAGDIGLPYAGPYSASKAALVRLCQSLRPELEQAGITLSLIEPGFVATPLTAKNDFPMPFLISAERAARIICRALAKRRFRIRFPLRMSLTMGFLAALPEWASMPLRRRMLLRP